MRGLLFKIETVILPPQDELELSVVNQCSEFRNTFLDQCKEEIAKDKRLVNNPENSLAREKILWGWGEQMKIFKTRILYTVKMTAVEMFYYKLVIIE